MDRTQQAAATQKELVDAYQHVSRHWLDRMQSEITTVAPNSLSLMRTKLWRGYKSHARLKKNSSNAFPPPVAGTILLPRAR
jgi:hypothetical protein